MGIHTHEATQNIQETYVLSFSVDEKKITQLIGTMDLGFSIPKQFLEMSVYRTPLAFTDAFLLGNKAGFLKQREWVLERRKRSRAVKPLSV